MCVLNYLNKSSTGSKGGCLQNRQILIGEIVCTILITRKVVYKRFLNQNKDIFTKILCPKIVLEMLVS